MDYIHLKESVRDLENRVLRSEMRRQELEHQFEFLMRDRTKCEQQSAIKLLKHRCEHAPSLLPPSSRNRGLLQMLERIDYQAATLAAKTEQLKLLKTQHELNLMSQWSTANNSRPIDHRSYPDHPQAPDAPGPSSEFVRFARNAQPAAERHVAFADDHHASAHPPSQPVILRPPMDFLTYAGKRWILDPTQFAEPAVPAPPPPMVVCEPEPMMRRPRSKDYHHQQPYRSRSESSKRQHQDLLSKLQSVQPLLQQRYAPDDEAPQTPLRARVYPKFATGLVKDELRVRGEEEDEPPPPSDDELFESFVERVNSDTDVVIEDIVEPEESSELTSGGPIKNETVIEPIKPVVIKAPAESRTNINSTVEGAEKKPAALSFEDVLYGEKIADDGFVTAVPKEQIVDSVKETPLHNQQEQLDPSQTIELTNAISNIDIINPQTTQPEENSVSANPTAEFTVAVEEYNYQPNEPVYSDADYSKQYEYQEYDQSAYDPGNNPSAAVEYDQQQASYAADPNYAQPNQMMYENVADQSQQQQQEHVAAYPEQDQAVYDASQYATSEPSNAADPNNAQETYAEQQYADYDQQQQQYAPDPNAEAAYPPTAHQPIDDPAAYDYDQQQQYATTDPNADGAQNPDVNAQQYAQSDQQQYADDPNNYYAQADYDAQPQDDTYDPNAEYQVAQEVADPNAQPDAYYADPQQQQPVADDQLYYPPDPSASVQYGDYEQSGDQQQLAGPPLAVAPSVDDSSSGGDQPASDVVIDAPVVADSSPIIAAANYVTSEADDSNNVSGMSAATAADGSLAANTESDFDFSVK